MSSLKDYLRKIVRLKYKLKPLYEELEYLEMKSLCYNGPNFENEGIRSSNVCKDPFAYWFDRIDTVERKINAIEKELVIFERFKASLSESEVIILEKHLMVGYPPRIVIQELNVTRSKFYELRQMVSNKYLKQFK